MSESQGTTQHTEVVRKETFAVLESLRYKAAEFELAQPPDALEQYYKKLQENTYKVLVAGETKRGKSSFVNALIGRDILPTEVQVATNQVFYVSQAEREAYRVRFEDDSVREITLEDLPRYGSQVMEDAGERPQLDQQIRWIEVDEPHIRYLPKGVSLLDTPGLGALYAAHAQITYRFVPQADAVIFVLDSEKQIVQTELDFIGTILDVTPNMFFIQTKIDLFGEEDWHNIQERNREILQERFKDRLTDTRIWPISSKLLLAAAAGGEDAEEDLEDSRHEELESALRAFLFRVAGWSRSAAAVVLAHTYHITSRQVLAGRLDTFESSEQRRAELEQRAENRVRQFELDWGPHGQKRQELVVGIQRIVAEGKGRIREAVRPGGPIDTEARATIEAAGPSEEAAKQLFDTMPADMSARAVEEWRQVWEVTQTRCIELLEPFLDDAGSMSVVDYPDSQLPEAPNASLGEVQNKLWQKLEGSRKVLLPVGAAVGIAGVVLSVVAGPAAILRTAVSVAKVATGLFGTVRLRYESLSEQQQQSAKDQLRKYSELALQRVREQLLEGDASSGQTGLADEQFAALERAMLDRVHSIVQRKEEEARAEYARLVEAGRLDDQQREEGMERTRRQLAEWDTIGKNIEDLGARLNALDQILATSSPATREA